MQANEIPITGIVLHFRTPEKTLACLQSMRDEGVCKAIIIDNSEDKGKSIAAMQQRIGDLNSSGFETVVLSEGHNLGFAAGVNYGLKYLTAGAPSHVLLINSDARLQVGSLEKMRLAFKNAAIIAPRIAQSDEPPSSPFAYYDRLLGLITWTPKATALRYASGCCLFIRSDVAEFLLFDQDFFFYGEDTMLGFTIQQHGISIMECPEALVFHATSSSAKNGSIFYEYHMNRAHWLLAHKLACNPFQLFVFIAARCLTLPMRALVRSLRYRSLNAWHGLFTATFDVIRGRCRTFTPPVT